MDSNLIKYSDKVDDAQNIVITGSSGWLSSNFLFHLKKFKSEKKIIIHKFLYQKNNYTEYTLRSNKLKVKVITYNVSLLVQF